LTVLRSDHEVALVVIARPAALGDAEILQTVAAVRIDSRGSRGGRRVDDLAQRTALTVFSSLTTPPSAVAAFFGMNWCMYVLSGFHKA
jgi:hypothetical protein